MSMASNYRGLAKLAGGYFPDQSYWSGFDGPGEPPPGLTPEQQAEWRAREWDAQAERAAKLPQFERAMGSRLPVSNRERRADPASPVPEDKSKLTFKSLADRSARQGYYPGADAFVGAGGAVLGGKGRDGGEFTPRLRAHMGATRELRESGQHAEAALRDRLFNEEFNGGLTPEQSRTAEMLAPNFAGMARWSDRAARSYLPEDADAAASATTAYKDYENNIGGRSMPRVDEARLRARGIALDPAGPYDGRAAELRFEHDLPEYRRNRWKPSAVPPVNATAMLAEPSPNKPWYSLSNRPTRMSEIPGADKWNPGLIGKGLLDTYMPNYRPTRSEHMDAARRVGDFEASYGHPPHTADSVSKTPWRTMWELPAAGLPALAGALAARRSMLAPPPPPPPPAGPVKGKGKLGALLMLAAGLVPGAVLAARGRGGPGDPGVSGLVQGMADRVYGVPAALGEVSARTRDAVLYDQSQRHRAAAAGAHAAGTPVKRVAPQGGYHAPEPYSAAGGAVREAVESARGAIGGAAESARAALAPRLKDAGRSALDWYMERDSEYRQ
jgi:hypothetical protein